MVDWQAKLPDYSLNLIDISIFVRAASAVVRLLRSSAKADHADRQRIDAMQ